MDSFQSGLGDPHPAPLELLHVVPSPPPDSDVGDVFVPLGSHHWASGVGVEYDERDAQLKAHRRMEGQDVQLRTSRRSSGASKVESPMQPARDYTGVIVRISMHKGRIVASGGSIAITSFPRPVSESGDTARQRMSSLVSKNLQGGLHPFMLHAIGFAFLGDDRDELCLISPWFGDEQIRDHLAQNPKADRNALVQDVTEGLVHLHNCGIVHSDLQPCNIIVNRQGGAMIKGFGLADILGQDAPELHSVRFSVPEILEEAKPNVKTDIYSLACVILDILTGRPPYASMKREQAIIVAQCQGKLPAREDYPTSDLTDMVWSLLVKCWNIEPNLRPTMTEVGVILLPSKEGSATAHRPEGPEAEASSIHKATTRSTLSSRRSSRADSQLSVAPRVANTAGLLIQAFKEQLHPPIREQRLDNMDCTGRISDLQMMAPNGSRDASRRDNYGSSDTVRGEIEDMRTMVVAIQPISTLTSNDDPVAVRAMWRLARHTREWLEIRHPRFCPWWGTRSSTIVSACSVHGASMATSNNIFPSTLQQIGMP